MSTPIINKVVTAEEALEKVPDGAVIAISGFNMATAPIYLIHKLYERYERTGRPKNIFIISDTYPGVPGKGLDAVAEKVYNEENQEFLRGVLMPFLGWSPWLQKLATDNKIEVYTWSIGIAAYWFREVASGRPGILSRVGLNTFLDPRQGGGALNDLARERRTCKVEIIKLDDKEYLFYQAPKPNVALIRGTTSDEIGNITMEKEGIFGTVLNIAQAAKARPSPGIVIAQVERIARFGSLNSQQVFVPGPLVDYVVVSPPEYHRQSGNIQFDPRICGRIVPPLTPELIPKLNLTPQKIVARRILLEMIKLVQKFRRQIVVNLGIGIPSYVARIAAEEKVSDFLVSTVESGPWGGIALTGPDFGVSIGPFAIIPMPDQFSMYEGGIIDAASLGFLQVDKEGNVNPSILPKRLPGPGGFPVIAAGSPRTFFGGGFTAGKREIKVEDGELKIFQDGPIIKFVNSVYQVVFNGRVALEEGKEILYITERAVFRLTKDGLVLEEYAPGVDIDKDIIGKMEFRPKVSPKLQMMDRRLFKEEVMGLREEVESILRR